MKKGLSILALSLSLVATAASARFCPSPAYIKKQSYELQWDSDPGTGRQWLFESEDCYDGEGACSFIFVKGNTFEDASAAVQAVLKEDLTLKKSLDYGHCIYKGKLAPQIGDDPEFSAAEFPTVGYW